MSSYLPLFSVSVEHGFFNGAICSGLEFIATSKTMRIISNAGLLLRNSSNGIYISYDESRLEALQQYIQEPNQVLSFEFKVYSSFPGFKGCTEPFSWQCNDILYFSNEGVKIAEGSSILLHKQECASKDDLVSTKSDQVINTLSHKDQLIPPVFVINISLNKNDDELFDEQLKPVNKNYKIRFKPRKTVWKYYLLGETAKQNAYVSDQDELIDFETIGETVMDDQRVAMTFRSKQTIPLSENYTFNFQLKQNTDGVERVLIKRLPVARINQTGKEVVAEQGMVVSEIYINS